MSNEPKRMVDGQVSMALRAIKLMALSCKAMFWASNTFLTSSSKGSIASLAYSTSIMSRTSRLGRRASAPNPRSMRVSSLTLARLVQALSDNHLCESSPVASRPLINATVIPRPGK
jgi:hypothetical protein